MSLVKLMGATELARNIDRIQKALDDEFEGAAKAGAGVIRDEARAIGERVAMSDRSGGHMVKGIKTFKPEKVDKSTIRIIIGVKPALWYGVFPEFGTSKMQARPFMRPALDNKAGEAQEAFAEHMQTALKKAVRRGFR